MRESDVYGKLVQDRKVVSVNRWKTFENNISNGRKIFRLLLWLNEIGEFLHTIKDKRMQPKFKILKLTSLACSFFYYLIDNIVWFSNIGFVSKFFYGSTKWKQLKNLFSLTKTILEILLAVYNVYLKTHQEINIRKKLH
jgi:hypothetical protein